MTIQTRQRKCVKDHQGRQDAKNPEVKEAEIQSGSGDATSLFSESVAKSKPADKKQRKNESAKNPTDWGWLGSCCSKAKYVLLLLFIPPFLNFASLQREAVELKPQGELYDVGWGRKMYLSCSGNGSPTVVLDAPTGMSSDVWSLVAEKLRETANVCIYDRAGLGFSERPQNNTASADEPGSQLKSNSDLYGAPFTVESMAEDLYKLISSSSQQPRPLILVGAELGALVAQFYTHLYGEADVLGLVLVNPLPEDLFSQQAGDVWVNHWFGRLGPHYQSLQLGAAMGVTRLGLLFGALNQPVVGENIPEVVKLRQKYLLCHPRHLSSVVDEHHFINETFSQMKTLRKLRSLPSNVSVSVLSGNYYDEQLPNELNKAWAIGEQKLLTKLGSTVNHFVVNGADRHMLYRKPEVVVDAVIRLIRAWKRSGKKM